MFARRALTAAVLLAAFFAAVLLLDRTSFAGLIGMIVALAAYEWARLSGLRAGAAWGYAAAAVILVVLVLAALRGPRPARFGFETVWAVALLFWLVAVPLTLARGVQARLRRWYAAAGLAVLVPAGLAAATLPPRALLALLGLVWVADTAAYLAGSAVGRRKLAPVLSPGKTWEGVVGGVLATLAYAIILAAVLPEMDRRLAGPAWVGYLAGVTMLYALSVLGDLFESALKRHAGVKDSSALLPGHGGVLDRIDSASAVLPAGALLLTLSGLA